MDTQVRKGKARERVSLEREYAHARGTYANVFLTEEQYQQLRSDYPTTYQEKIDYFSGYMQRTGKTYADHYATIVEWAKADAKKGAKKSGRPLPTASSRPPSFDIEAANTMRPRVPAIPTEVETDGE